MQQKRGKRGNSNGMTVGIGVQKQGNREKKSTTQKKEKSNTLKGEKSDQEP